MFVALVGGDAGLVQVFVDDLNLAWRPSECGANRWSIVTTGLPPLSDLKGTASNLGPELANRPGLILRVEHQDRFRVLPCRRFGTRLTTGPAEQPRESRHDRFVMIQYVSEPTRKPVFLCDGLPVMRPKVRLQGYTVLLEGTIRKNTGIGLSDYW